MIPSTLGRHRPWILLSFLVDWIIIAAISIVTYFISIRKPHYREFSLADTTLMYTHAKIELVPFWLLAVLCFLIVPILITLVTLVMGKLEDLNRRLLGLGLSLAICAIIVESLKPRPDMLSRCRPPMDAFSPPFGLSNYTICTAGHDTALFIDGFKSFPSAHAAYSFASFTYLSLLLAGLNHLLNQQGDWRILRSVIFWIPIAGALFITMSRFQDCHHHWSDLLIGGIFGVICAVFGYRQYHPSLFEDDHLSTRRISRCNPIYNQGEEAQNDNNQQHDDPDNILLKNVSLLTFFFSIASVNPSRFSLP